MKDNSNVFGRNDPAAGPRLELVLLDRAREHRGVDEGEFRCPDCAGDEPMCSTCGEPSRFEVERWLDEGRAA